MGKNRTLQRLSTWRAKGLVLILLLTSGAIGKHAYQASVEQENATRLVAPVVSRLRRAESVSIYSHQSKHPQFKRISDRAQIERLADGLNPVSVLKLTEKYGLSGRELCIDIDDGYHDMIVGPTAVRAGGTDTHYFRFALADDSYLRLCCREAGFAYPLFSEFERTPAD